ncbi:MAG: restriction endonuclease subunit S [Pyrinomonadaceae bacterium]
MSQAKKIMADWKEYKLKDVLSEKGYIRGPFGSSLKRDEMTKEGIPVYEQQHAIYNTRDFRFFIDNEKYKELERFTVKENDLIISCSGTVGKVSIIKTNDPKGIISQALLLLRPNNEIILPEYLLYFFKTANGFYQLVNASHGSVQINIASRDVVESIPISIPNKNIQKEILSILSSLDDKIDLLHRQNKTLEAMAETLFRQWFVEEAEESWETTGLFDVVELVGGGTPKTDIAEYWDGDIQWISAKDITPNHKKFIIATEKKITEQGLSNSSARLLPKYATIISARGTVGNYCILSESMTFSQSNYGIKPKFKDCYFFTYLLIANAVEELQSAAYGSVFDTITTSTFKEHQIKIPREEEIQIFNEEVKPYFEKMLSNEIQIHSLTKLRDTLLPKLMSGEVPVAVD